MKQQISNAVQVLQQAQKAFGVRYWLIQDNYNRIGESLHDVDGRLESAKFDFWIIHAVTERNLIGQSRGIRSPVIEDLTEAIIIASIIIECRIIQTVRQHTLSIDLQIGAALFLLLFEEARDTIVIEHMDLLQLFQTREGR